MSAVKHAVRSLSAPSPFDRGTRAVVAESAHPFLRAQHLEGTSEVLLDTHHCAAVVELPTVVGGGEDSDQLLLCEELIAVLNYLVSPADQIQFVLSQESADDLLPEHETDSSFGLAPHLHRGLGVGPQQVAEQSSVWDVGGTDDAVDLIDGS